MFEPLLAALEELSLMARVVMLLCVWVIGMFVGACIAGEAMKTGTRYYTSCPLWYALLTVGAIVGVVVVAVLVSW